MNERLIAERLVGTKDALVPARDALITLRVEMLRDEPEARGGATDDVLQGAIRELTFVIGDLQNEAGILAAYRTCEAGS